MMMTIKHCSCETHTKPRLSEFRNYLGIVSPNHGCLCDIFTNPDFSEKKIPPVTYLVLLQSKSNLDGDQVHTVPLDPSKAWSIGLK